MQAVNVSLKIRYVCAQEMCLIPINTSLLY
jgi:hypothetical protein